MTHLHRDHGRNRSAAVFSLFALVLSICPRALLGQRSSAGISGLVTDPSGAVVPAAQITATETSTQTVTKALTNEGGLYDLPNLQPGTYVLRVEKVGFEGYSQGGITLQVGQPVSVNVTLTLGSSTQLVTVAGQPHLVSTVDQTVSYAVTPQFVDDVPLNGRIALQMMALAPDASAHSGPYNGAEQAATRPDASVSYVTASGEGMMFTTSYYLNGGLAMDPYTNSVNVLPNPDAIQEFTYDTSAYNAKFGGSGGGVVNAATKSGTNQFHGTAFEYVRNGDLNGRNFFSATQDTLKRNQYGFSFGGPIQKDKTFGFISYQETTMRYATTTNVAYGPTAAELEGNWSAIPVQLMNPATGTPYTGNLVNPTTYNSISVKLLNYVPMGTGANGQIIYNAFTVDNDPQWVGRVDRNFGPKLRISGNFLWDSYDAPLVGQNQGNILTGGDSKKWASVVTSLNASYVFNPRLFTTLSIAYSRGVYSALGSTLFPTIQELGATNIPDLDPPQYKPIQGDIESWFAYGWNAFTTQPRNEEDFSNNWTYVRGNHILDFGAEEIISQTLFNSDFVSGGYNAWTCTQTGYNPVDFLLGLGCSFEQFAPEYIVPQNAMPALYANDKWKIKRDLTVNLGLRWEPWLPFADHSSYREGDVFVPSAFANGTHSTRYPNLPPGLFVPGDPGIPPGGFPSQWAVFDPRVGLAWNVLGKGTTSVRAGFGLYRVPGFGEYASQNPTTVPWTVGGTFSNLGVSAYSPYDVAPYNGVIPTFQLPPTTSEAFPTPIASTVYSFDDHAKPMAIMEWNLTIEHQLPSGIMLHTGYEASEGYHLLINQDINSPPCCPAGATEANMATRRPDYPYYGGPIAQNLNQTTASYNALDVSVEKRMTGNLSFLGGFRWAKCLDTGSIISLSKEETADPYDRRLDRGLCWSDLGLTFKMAAVWRMPSFASRGFVMRHFLGGWKSSGILNWEDGYPYTVFSGEDTALNGVSNRARDNIIGNPYLPGNRSTSQKLAEWFNTAAFAIPATGTYGDAARCLLRGPGYSDLDFALIKSFPLAMRPLGEGSHIDFRAEAFNLFNHPNFGEPNSTSSAVTNFGEITSANSPRIMQFALKLFF